MVYGYISLQHQTDAEQNEHLGIILHNAQRQALCRIRYKKHQHKAGVSIMLGYAAICRKLVVITAQ